MAGSVTVDGLTVPAEVHQIDYKTFFAGWMPDTEGLEFSVVAAVGKRATVTTPGGRSFEGTITAAHREDCDVWVEVPAGWV